MCGWFQAIHATAPPEGLSFGPVRNRYESSVNSRTRASSPCRVRSTAAMTRLTSVGPGPVCSSRTAHTTDRSRSTTGSDQRSAPGNAGAGLIGSGSRRRSGSNTYSRWSS
nr:hypothetical protein GCM10025732_42900 [Glycomyces mayteni]